MTNLEEGPADADQVEGGAKWFNTLLVNIETVVIGKQDQVAMALVKEWSNHSRPEIGDAFGGRDHTTVLHGCRRVAALRETDRRIDDDYLNLLRTLTG